MKIHVGVILTLPPLTTEFGVTIFAGQSYFNLPCLVLKYVQIEYRVYKQIGHLLDKILYEQSS